MKNIIICIVDNSMQLLLQSAFYEKVTLRFVKQISVSTNIHTFIIV